ncbi:MAG: hypothetical protein M3378_01265 [Actinomycetota bacterium]|nr:hypothetical protein [Actinomycetota bacterium]
MAEFPPLLKDLLQAVQILPLPSQRNPGEPLDLRLSHDASSFDALRQVRELGSYVLDIKRLSLPGIGLDPSRNTLTVDLNQIDLGQIASDVRFSLGELQLSGAQSTLDLKVVSRSTEKAPSFATVLAAPATPGATTVSTRAAPAVGAVVEVDSAPTAEVRTVAGVSGTGPYTVTLAPPALGLAHLANVPVTQRIPVGAVDLDPAETAVPLTETLGLGSRLVGMLARAGGVITQLATAALSQVPGRPGTVEGVLGPKPGAATITLPGLAQIAGTAGEVAASIKQSVLPSGTVPTVEVRWSITDEAGRELTGTPDLVVVNGALSGVLGSVTLPTIAFLPEFVDLGAVGTAVRRVSCTLTLKAAGFTDFPRTIGPIPVTVPQVGLPTVLALSDQPGDVRDPSAVLVAVPGSYPSWDWRTLMGFLGTARGMLQPVMSLPPDLRVGLGEMVGVIDRLLHLLDVQPAPVSFFRTNEVLDLFWETRAPGWPSNWQDVISSMVFLGTEGRTVSLHNRPNLWSGTGAFEVTLGVLPVAMVDSLQFRYSSGSPEEGSATVIPATSRVEVRELPTKGAPALEPTTFDNVISSFQFLPPPSVPSVL